MAVRVTVKMDPAAIRRLGATREGIVAREIFRRSKLVEGKAKRLCPVDTGRLRASITTELLVRDGQFVGQIGTNVNYAIFVHEGTRFVRPRPFLRDALDAAGR